MVARADTVLYIAGHRKWYIASLVVSVVLFAWAAYVVHGRVVLSWEPRVMLELNHRASHWRTLALVFSNVGGSPWTALIAVAVSYALKLYRLTWRLAVSFLLATALIYGARHLVAQPNFLPLVHDLHVRIAVSNLAFPSAATTIATVIALSILPYLPNSLRLVLPLWIIIVACSRIYLGAQTPLDLIGGLALGAFLVSLIRVMPQAVRVLCRLD